jgi:hypothetical protein
MAPMISSLKVFLVLQNSFQTIKYIQKNVLFIYIYILDLLDLKNVY